jgi:Holliday junction resolvasome RuvABC endonuclease subunit
MKQDHGRQRWFQIVENILLIVKNHPTHKITHVVIEDYAYGGTSKGIVLGELGGIVRYELIRHKIPFFEVGIGQWKKSISGSGNADKKAILKVIQEHYKPSVVNDNESDAIGIAVATAELFASKIGLNLPNNVALLTAKRDPKLKEALKHRRSDTKVTSPR